MISSIFLFQVRSEDQLNCIDENSTFFDLVKFMKINDVANETYIPGKRYLGDWPLDSGAIIDSSCFRDAKDVIDRKIIYDRFEILTRHMLQKVNVCMEDYGFEDLKKIPSVLRRTDFICKDGGRDFAAKARTTRLRPLIEFNRSLSLSLPIPPVDYSGSDNYPRPMIEIVMIEKDELNKYPDSIPALNFILRKDIDRSITLKEDGAEYSMNLKENLAQVIFHELSHHTHSIESQNWHNSWRQEGIKQIGTEKSLFEDKVYFLSAVCFPQSKYGGLFWSKNGAAQSLEICKKALTHSNYKARKLKDESDRINTICEKIEARWRTKNLNH